MLVCAGRNETLCCAVPIGIGLVEASLGLTRLLLGGAREIENIIFVGSAGAYSKEILIGDMFFSVEATQIESSFLSGGSYTPIDNVMKMESVDLSGFGDFARFFVSDENLRDKESGQKNVSYETSEQTLKSIQNQKTGNQQKFMRNSVVARQIEQTKQVVVNSSNYITTDENSANQMAMAGIPLENMEFYAVMKVAQSFGVPAMGVFCVTNYCDENAHRDFLANHSEAKCKLEGFIMQSQKAMI